MQKRFQKIGFFLTRRENNTQTKEEEFNSKKIKVIYKKDGDKTLDQGNKSSKNKPDRKREESKKDKRSTHHSKNKQGTSNKKDDSNKKHGKGHHKDAVEQHHEKHNSNEKKHKSILTESKKHRSPTKHDDQDKNKRQRKSAKAAQSDHILSNRERHHHKSRKTSTATKDKHQNYWLTKKEILELINQRVPSDTVPNQKCYVFDRKHVDNTLKYEIVTDNGKYIEGQTYSHLKKLPKDEKPIEVVYRRKHRQNDHNSRELKDERHHHHHDKGRSRSTPMEEPSIICAYAEVIEQCEQRSKVGSTIKEHSTRNSRIESSSGEALKNSSSHGAKKCETTSEMEQLFITATDAISNRTNWSKFDSSSGRGESPLGSKKRSNRTQSSRMDSSSGAEQSILSKGRSNRTQRSMSDVERSVRRFRPKNLSKINLILVDIPGDSDRKCERAKRRNLLFKRYYERQEDNYSYQSYSDSNRRYGCFSEEDSSSAGKCSPHHGPQLQMETYTASVVAEPNNVDSKNSSKVNKKTRLGMYKSKIPVLHSSDSSKRSGVAKDREVKETAVEANLLTAEEMKKPIKVKRMKESSTSPLELSKGPILSENVVKKSISRPQTTRISKVVKKEDTVDESKKKARSSRFDAANKVMDIERLEKARTAKARGLVLEKNVNESKKTRKPQVESGPQEGSMFKTFSSHQYLKTFGKETRVTTTSDLETTMAPSGDSNKIIPSVDTEVEKYKQELENTGEALKSGRSKSSNGSTRKSKEKVKIDDQPIINGKIVVMETKSVKSDRCSNRKNRSRSNSTKSSSPRKHISFCSSKSDTHIDRKPKIIERQGTQMSISNSTFGDKSSDPSKSSNNTSLLLTKIYRDEEKLNRWHKRKLYSDLVRKNLLDKNVTNSPNAKNTVPPQVMEIRFLTVSKDQNAPEVVPKISPLSEFFEKDMPEQNTTLDCSMEEKFDRMFGSPIDRDFEEILMENTQFLNKDFTVPMSPMRLSLSDEDDEEVFGNKEDWIDCSRRDEDLDNGIVNEVYYCNERFDHPSTETTFSKNIASEEGIQDSSCSAPGSEESGYATISMKSSFFKKPHIKALFDPPTSESSNIKVRKEVQTETSSVSSLELFATCKSLQTVVNASQKSMQFSVSQDLMGSAFYSSETLSTNMQTQRLEEAEKQTDNFDEEPVLSDQVVEEVGKEKQTRKWVKRIKKFFIRRKKSKNKVVNV